MYNLEREKLSRTKHDKNPSFSSTLLDEIYRSIDGYDQRREDIKLPKETRKQSSNVVAKAKAKAKANHHHNKNNKSIEDEEIASFRRACLIEKWMEKKAKDKVLMTRKGPSSLPELDNNDPLFFSSNSSESNSGTLSASSSEADCFYTETSTRTTCFAAPRITKSMRRASVSPSFGRRENPMYTEQSNEFYLFDDYKHNQLQAVKNDESLIKSNSRALKIYNNLKKVKQPISPGGRLTSFLSSIFNNGNGKKNKNLNDPNGINSERNSKSTCSSASSFSRSCLSKTPSKFSDKYQNGVKRTVRFNPVSVIVDEDCRPCGHKSIYDQDSGNLRRAKSQGNATIMEKNRKFEMTKVESYQHLKNKKNDYIVDYAEEEEEEDAASCSSSDLFEIDHLAFFGNNRFCEELPVYETTHLDTNRGIASGFIR
ncbi:hypothetical protein RND71_043097 [Anisodus tanguticus]|uniref:Protein BIG GRAIN 1-like B n=1 Tax=Anisodus tanguticus TaxID=243964 RepID=A0AAE1QS62_9SOLA|nr:hypothetical protein RND71_043097 [Anisodus tanguticus]